MYFQIGVIGAEILFLCYYKVANIKKDILGEEGAFRIRLWRGMIHHGVMCDGSECVYIPEDAGSAGPGSLFFPMVSIRS
jgi:hypothetical protein